jgi:Protein of unknown function (DUF2742)
MSASRPVWARSVNWWDVHEFVAGTLARVGSWPMAGTPEWCSLPDDNPAKIAALFDAARHWALRVDTLQTAECEASHAVSAAFDWSGFSVAQRRHNEFYNEKPWLRRAKRVDS